MILADALSISINLLLVAHVVISLLLILVVLMQRPKQEGLGAAFGGGMTDQMFGAQTTNVLQKGTVYLGTLFVVLSLVLAILIGNQNHQEAIAAPAPDTVEEAPAVPDVVPGGGSIKEELEKTGEGTTPTEGGIGDAPADADTTTPAEGDAPVDTDAGTPAEGDAPTPADGGASTPPAPGPDSGSSTPSDPASASGDPTAPAGDGAAPAADPAPPADGGEEDKPE